MRRLKYQFERAALLILAALILGGGAYAAMMGNRTSIQEIAETDQPTEVSYILAATINEDKPLETEMTEPEPTQEPSRYAEISLTDEDVEVLARLVWLEARGEPFDGQVAVAEVVFNRILSDRFPGQDDVQTVIFKENQFSPSPYIWSDSTTPTEEQYEAVWTAYAAEEPITDLDVVYFSTAPYNDKIFTVIGGHYFCRV